MFSHYEIRTTSDNEKFMAWERSFEARVNQVRAKELKYQKLSYTIEVCYDFLAPHRKLMGTCVLIGPVERCLERVPHSNDFGRFLALCRRSRADTDGINCLHFSKPNPLPNGHVY
jgi:hypothetical protein